MAVNKTSSHYDAFKNIVYLVIISYFLVIIMKPLDALGELLDKQVMVRLKNGIVITGVLKSFDVHINVVIADAVIKEEEVDKKFKTLFVRGDMILLVA